MKILLAAAVIVFFGCNSEKSSSAISADSTSVATGETKSATPTKSIILNNPSSDTEAKKTENIVPAPNTKEKGISEEKTGNSQNNKVVPKLPACIKTLIDKFKNEEVQNPPRKVYSYIYRGKIVFYVPALCCDFFSDLYDDDCRLIGHPDGGITGRGDGTAPDFIKTRTNEKLVWEDLRRSR